MNKRLLWILPLFFLVLAVPVSADLTTDVAFSYSFDDVDTSGSTAVDASGNVNGSFSGGVPAAIVAGLVFGAGSYFVTCSVFEFSFCSEGS